MSDLVCCNATVNGTLIEYRMRVHAKSARAKGLLMIITAAAAASKLTDANSIASETGRCEDIEMTD